MDSFPGIGNATEIIKFNTIVLTFGDAYLKVNLIAGITLDVIRDPNN